MKSFDNVVSFASHEEGLCDIAAVIDISATFLASSSDCKGVFSLMNMIKMKTHNWLRVVHLEVFMRIKSHQNSGPEIDLDKVWASAEDHCQKLDN